MPTMLAPDELEGVTDPLDFTATDVTGLRMLEFEGVDGHRFASDIAMSVASQMELPTSASQYSLRDDLRARMLLDDQPLGRQVQRGAKLVVIPKAHLG